MKKDRSDPLTHPTALIGTPVTGQKAVTPPHRQARAESARKQRTEGQVEPEVEPSEAPMADEPEMPAGPADAATIAVAQAELTVTQADWLGTGLPRPDAWAAASTGPTGGSATPSWLPDGLTLGLGAGGVALLGLSSRSTSAAPPSPGVVSKTATVSGAITLGPAVAGHTLVVSAYDSAGRLIAQAPLDASGRYTLSIPSGYTGPLLLRVTDADDRPDYIDEATGQPRDLDGELRSVAVLGSSGIATAHVTPLTELVVRKLGLASGQDAPSALTLGTISAEQIDQVKFKVAQALGLGGLDLMTASPEPIIDIEGRIDVSRANAYGKLLAALSGMEAGEGQGTDRMLQALSDSLDLQTGTLSPEGLMDLVSGARLVAQSDPQARALFSLVGQAIGLSAAQIDSIDTAWGTLLNLADGVDNNGPGLNAAQLSALGIRRVDSDAKRDALNNVLDVKNAAAVQSRSKLQAWADTITVVLSTAAGGAAAPTQEALEELGLTNLTPGRTTDLI
jgi:hypothetical protein